ncbi:hypothetical protein PVAND_008065 [Polypedilum vanderplanki]|uniref:Uncharacterized protein n=1 Tax=Polypedilum vanderplanki TaxID=319348 RepID=A0A9J6C8K2_POLVA|nr:hypothetical protein PVAND_008065 [Polypedilum vanderplanki]
MKSIIIFTIIAVASCDVAFIGQGWSKDESGYNYPKAKAYEEIYEEENDLTAEIDYTPEVVDIFEIQPKTDEVAVEEINSSYLPPVPSNEYLPAKEYRKRRRSQIKRQTPVGRRNLRRTYRKL